MCGIAGFREWRPGTFSPEDLKSMCDKLSHRGPDGSGLHLASPIGFSHRRLAIIDLTEGGHQPRVDPNNGDALTFNGEIYNFITLRSEMESLGTKFLTESDSEVLFKGLQMWGGHFLEKIDGDFGLAYWNSSDGSLLLARDPFGVKPLYYLESPRGVIFASEIKVLLPFASNQVSSEVLSEMMSFRYSRGEDTLFPQIKKVPPRTCIKWNHDGLKTVAMYWTPNLNQGSSHEPDGDLNALLGLSVSSRTIADVPVGAFLSGGIDSSVIADRLAANHPSIETFTYKVKGHEFDAEQAQQLSWQLKLKNHLIDPSESWDHGLSKALWHLEEPLGDSMILPTYKLGQAASRHVKVVLSGEGADELFAGYAHQFALFLTHRLKRIPLLSRISTRTLKSIPTSILSQNPLYPTPIEPEMIERWQALQESDHLVSQYSALARLFSINEIKLFLNGPVQPDYLHEKLNSDWSKAAVLSPDPLKQLLLFDMDGWLPNYGLLRIDKLNMAHGLEIRVPYLQKDLMEWVLSHPTSRLFSLRMRKPLLRSYAAGRPHLSAIARRKKHPFFLPLEKIHAQEVYQWATEILTVQRINHFGILNSTQIGSWLTGLKPTFVSYKKLFWLASFQLWCEVFLDQKVD